LPEFLTSDDFLVVNATQVFRARLFGTKAVSGGKCELLLLKEHEHGLWSSLVKPGRGMARGTELLFPNVTITAIVTEVMPDGTRLLAFHPPDSVPELMNKIGEIPLPPYIDRPAEPLDSERYQTVYARVPGSVAAPTAGLHFTPELLCGLKGKGIEIIELSLNIGWGTFQPVREQDIRMHKMEKEQYCITSQTAARIETLRDSGKKLVAVGTTSVRALESWFIHTNGKLTPLSRATDLFIYPPYQFKLVDKLLTNFHLPQSSLLMLVSAFAGRENILRVYRCAVEAGYRFFSYGDCMLIL